MQAPIEPQIADDEIRSPMAGEVPGDDTIPPAVALLEPRNDESLELTAADVPEDGDRHPFTDDQEIDSTVAIHVAPHCIRYQPDVLEFGRELRGDIGEPPTPVVLQQRALRVTTVVSGDDAPSHEEINRPIAIVVGSDDT